MNGTTHMVMWLHLWLGKHVRLEDTHFRDVAGGCSLHCVSDDKLLNGLVFGYTSNTAHTVNRLHLALALFGMTTVLSLLCHLGREDPNEPSWLYILL